MRDSDQLKTICEDIKAHVSEVLVEWEQRVREEPWYSLPPDHRINNLPNVVIGLVEASLCQPENEEAHLQAASAAAAHGTHRREQQIPEHLILTEFHLLRLALWRYLTQKFGSTEQTTQAIMEIDTAISLATNASMWGYYRPEVEGQTTWEEALERIVSTSPFLKRDSRTDAS